MDRYYHCDGLAQSPETIQQFMQCAAAVWDRQFTVQKCSDAQGETVVCLRLPDGTLFAAESVVAVVLSDWAADDGRYTFQAIKTFCDTIRRACSWQVLAKPLEAWCRRNLRDPYFTDRKIRPDEFYWDYILKSDVNIAAIPTDFLAFGAYCGLCFRQYSVGQKQRIGDEILIYVQELGADYIVKWQQEGTGRLPQEVLVYQDDNVALRANDAMGTIKISIYHESLASYAKALEWLCNLLQADFPQCYAINFQSKVKTNLNVKGLPKKGVYRFFANAATYPELWDAIAQYARLAMRRDAWYTDMSGEEAAMTGTYAVMALLDHHRRYLPLVDQYTQLCDRERSAIQAKFTHFIVERYGVDAETLPILLRCICAYAYHRSSADLAKAFADGDKLQLLLAAKSQLAFYLDTPALAEFITQNPQLTDQDATAQYLTAMWQHIVGVIFGKSALKKTAEFIEKAPDNLKPLYQQLLMPYDAH